MKTTKQITIAISTWTPMSLTRKTIPIAIPAQIMNERRICRIPIVNRIWVAAAAAEEAILAAVVAGIEEEIQMLAWTVITAIQMQYQWIIVRRLANQMSRRHRSSSHHHQIKACEKDHSFIIQCPNRVATVIFIVVVLVIITRIPRHPHIIIASTAHRTVSTRLCSLPHSFRIWNAHTYLTCRCATTRFIHIPNGSFRKAADQP